MIRCTRPINLKIKLYEQIIFSINKKGRRYVLKSNNHYFGLKKATQPKIYLDQVAEKI